MCLAHPTWHWKCGLLNQKHFWPNILFVPNQDQSKINKPLSSQYITNNLHIAHRRWHWKLYLHNQNIFWPNTVHSLDLRRTKLSMALTPKKIIFCQDWPQQKTIHFNLAYQIPTIWFPAFKPTNFFFNPHFDSATIKILESKSDTTCFVTSNLKDQIRRLSMLPQEDWVLLWVPDIALLYKSNIKCHVSINLLMQNWVQ